MLFATHQQGVQVGTCSPSVQPVASQIVPRGLCPICFHWCMLCVCHMVQSVPVWKVLLRHLALCHTASWEAYWPQPLQISLWGLKINSGSDRLQDIKSDLPPLVRQHHLHYVLAVIKSTSATPVKLVEDKGMLEEILRNSCKICSVLVCNLHPFHKIIHKSHMCVFMGILHHVHVVACGDQKKKLDTLEFTSSCEPPHEGVGNLTRILYKSSTCS